jgi:hypothetical protein
MLNKKLIIEVKFGNQYFSIINKSIATILIWFVAFFPLSYLGVMEIISMPEKNAHKREVLRLQEEIENYSTYADLSPFGLGIFKLENKGDRGVSQNLG